MLNLYFIRTPSSEGPLPVLAPTLERAVTILGGTDWGGTPSSAYDEFVNGRYTTEEIIEWEQLEDGQRRWLCWSDAPELEIDIGQFLFLKTGKEGPHA